MISYKAMPFDQTPQRAHSVHVGPGRKVPLPTSTAMDHWFAIVRSSAFAVHPFPNLMYNTWLMAYNSERKWGYAVCVNTDLEATTQLFLEVTTQFLVVQLCWIFPVDQ